MSTTDELSLRDIEILFRPFHFRKINLPTRIVMAPMTRSFAPGGIPTEEMAQYYHRRAQNGVGLILTEGTLIDEASASADSHCPSFFGGAALRGWKNICSRVHQTPCRIAPQLWHVGMARPLRGEIPYPEHPPIGPSGIDPVTLQRTGATMSRGKIAEVIDAFARAAADARKLGFDAVEIHGAHGYLIDQFFWEATNQRQDEYGGDLIARTRFAREVIQAVRKAVGRHFPILFRFSQWKVGHYDAKLAYTPSELADFLRPLSEAGVDIFDCSTRRYEQAEFAGSSLNLAGWTKKLTGKPTISVGSVGLQQAFSPENITHPRPTARTTLTRLLQMMRADEFDLIAVGRALLADPEWAGKIRDGRDDEIIPFSRRSLARLR